MHRYFEGWYYKMVDAGQKETLAIIPGVSFDKQGRGKAFIQVARASTGQAWFLEYDISSFSFYRPEFWIKIGYNTFSRNRLSMHTGQKEVRIDGQLAFSGLNPWPVNWKAPGAMGWFAVLPFMQCYHGVLSLDHEVSGSLEIDGETICFDE